MWNLVVLHMVNKGVDSNMENMVLVVENMVMEEAVYTALALASMCGIAMLVASAVACASTR
ncbi:MAG TPA: hypothetical protein V6C97_33295 [Oculatellaceae cyanobacterium]